MSGAKGRMRHKKMRNQPSNVTFSECRESTGRSSDCVQQHMKGPQEHQSSRMKGNQDRHEHALPTYITASLFAKARAAEVNAMLRAVTKTTGSSHVFGALPKHMRRRAMSHNSKRLPCRLREMAQRLLEKSQQAGKKEKKEQSKTKSRRARRRHGSLLLEFNRRQRKNKWLETHIWHAKRFHMLKKWGYCLGDRPTYKCYRASYRAMNSGCLLQDLSYYCCVELIGPEEQLLNALSRLTNKDAGPTFAAASCVSGQKEGRVMLYKADQYPHQPLGPVHFLWRPCCNTSPHRQLWIWAHPSLKQDVLPELQAVCQSFEAVAPAVVEAVPSEKLAEKPPASSDGIFKPKCTKGKRKRAAENKDYPAKKIVGDGTRSLTTPVSWVSCKTEIVISDLSMEIVRYRLIGPLSHSVLSEILVPATQCENINKSTASPFWWPEACKEEDTMSLHRQQADVFQLLRGIDAMAELPAGCVLGLTVDDPRLSLSVKKRNAPPDLRLSQGVDEEQRRNLILKGVPSVCAQSALWDMSLRENVTSNKISEQDLNRMKRELLVPGSRLPTPAQGRVPILLVNQAGKQLGEERLGWGSGWDLLLPKGWGMAFWTPLVYCGVRVGGLQMSLKHFQNRSMPHFPHDYPDCPAGVSFQGQQEIELLEKFKRYPPSKRTNYIKYGCVAPFRCLWQQLVEEWEEKVKQHEDIQDTKTIQMKDVPSLSGESPNPASALTVLRSRKVLRQLSVWCRPSSSRIRRTQIARCALPLCPALAVSLQEKWKQCILWVRVCVLSKGRPALHAMLCVPTTEDLQHLRDDPHWSGPNEPQHADHIKLQLKRRGKKGEAALSCSGLKKEQDCNIPQKDDPSPSPMMQKNPDLVSINQHSDPSVMLRDSLSEPNASVTTDPGHVCVESLSKNTLIQGLWTESLSNISSHCTRMTLGWVVQGDFSLATGTGEALGFVSMVGLLQTLLMQSADQRGVVLLRNPTSLQYRFARLHIEA
ncbi:ribonucleases P/MRP protein subunit POP1 [Tachysurus ichikawai]